MKIPGMVIDRAAQQPVMSELWRDMRTALDQESQHARQRPSASPGLRFEAFIQAVC